MFELRPLSTAAIPAALAKAERYRLLNESGQAESICQDVLAIDPDNQDALAMMILAITDQFRDEGTARHVGRAERLVPGLQDAYTQAYYGAIINERRARAALDAGRATMAYEWLLGALHGFDRAIGAAAGGQRRRGAAVERVRARPATSARAGAGRSRRVGHHVRVNDVHCHAAALRAARVFRIRGLRRFRDFLLGIARHAVAPGTRGGPQQRNPRPRRAAECARTRGDESRGISGSHPHAVLVALPAASRPVSRGFLSARQSLKSSKSADHFAAAPPHAGSDLTACPVASHGEALQSRRP